MDQSALAAPRTHGRGTRTAFCWRRSERANLVPIRYDGKAPIRLCANRSGPSMSVKIASQRKDRCIEKGHRAANAPTDRSDQSARREISVEAARSRGQRAPQRRALLGVDDRPGVE